MFARCVQVFWTISEADAKFRRLRTTYASYRTQPHHISKLQPARQWKQPPSCLRTNHGGPSLRGMLSDCVQLKTGQSMPLLGLGCSQVKNVGAVVEAALDAGYRHIDCAYCYLNEESVGEGIHRWLNKTARNRNEVFVVTKLPATGMHEAGVEKFLRLSLTMLKLDYVDLYLVHLPVGFKGAKDDHDMYPRDENNHLILDEGTDHIAIWKQMEKMVDLGLAKSIGLSNHNIKQMRRIMAIARIPPAVLQVELHLYLQQPKLQQYCQVHNIVLTGYAPLGSPDRKNHRGMTQILDNPVVRLVADSHSVTPAQVLLRFLVQQNISTIPKSNKPSRIKANLDVWGFSLSDVEMAALKSLDKGEPGRLFDLQKGFEPMKEHPEFPY